MSNRETVSVVRQEDAPGGGDVRFGSLKLTDPSNPHLTLEELRQEAWEQPWDTNTYVLLGNASTGLGVALIGPPLEALGSIAGTMKQFLHEITWATFYMEGYMTRWDEGQNPNEVAAHNANDENFVRSPETEYKGFIYVSKDVQEFVIHFRAEPRWRLVASGEEVFDPYNPWGVAAIATREELSW